ncbi:39S ribosomal protein L43, mitochondrial [Chrysoperla carnea]|uniref:39S ribosomal protein L43, mitochondrial n=1 Tax=Chrysoperla carnea TaxID=189513 RepID=UPI001D083A60|nr:39S ribosomal protein L43, mitochondrial [Chrysoperla carnea]
MSNSHLFLKSAFPRAPLQNGLGRYVCQLQRLTIRYCKSHGSSRGVREFLESKLLDFSKANEGVVVYVKPRRHKGPSLVAEYLNGDRQVIFCKDYTKEEVGKWIELLRTQSGEKTNVRFRKLWHTDNPSIQGPWTPFTFREPSINLTKFPNNELSSSIKLEPTATETLIELFEKQKLESK